MDSPLEEAVCCEPVSEMELGKSGFWGSDGKWSLSSSGLSKRLLLRLFFGIAAAADFAVYQRKRRLD
jgi:hypothetical protein